MENFSDPSEKTDEELVALSLENQDNFAFIINRYKDKLFKYIRRITIVSPEEAEDILQDVFIKTYRNLNGFDKDLKFSSWIYRIAHNQAISHFRKEKARPHGNAVPLDIAEIRYLASESDIEKDVDLKIAGEKIRRVLGKLDRKNREILVLKFIEQKSYKEISDILMVPMGTVATGVSRAKRQFREIYNNHI